MTDDRVNAILTMVEDDCSIELGPVTIEEIAHLMDEDMICAGLPKEITEVNTRGLNVLAGEPIFPPLKRVEATLTCKGKKRLSELRRRPE